MWGFRVTRAQIRHLVADLAQMSLERRCEGRRPQPEAGRHHRRRPGDHRADHAALARERGASAHARRARRPVADDDSQQARSVAVGHGTGVCLLHVPRSAVRPSKNSPRIAASICRTRGRSPASPARFGSNWPSPLTLERRRPRADRVGRAGGQRRLPDQLRRTPQAQLSLDPQQRAARLRAAATAAAGQRGPLPSRQSPPKKKHDAVIASYRRTISGACRRWRPSCGWRWRSTARTSSTWQTCAPACAAPRPNHRRSPRRCRSRRVGGRTKGRAVRKSVRPQGVLFRQRRGA